MKQAGGPVSPLLSMLTGTHTHAHTHNQQTRWLLPQPHPPAASLLVSPRPVLCLFVLLAPPLLLVTCDPSLLRSVLASFSSRLSVLATVLSHVLSLPSFHLPSHPLSPSPAFSRPLSPSLSPSAVLSHSLSPPFALFHPLSSSLVLSRPLSSSLALSPALSPVLSPVLSRPLSPSLALSRPPHSPFSTVFRPARCNRLA